MPKIKDLPKIERPLEPVIVLRKEFFSLKERGVL
jgi:hypothetical protein